MNRQIDRLYAIAAKPARTIVGLMSGTSLDGLDIALCHLQGAGRDTRLKVLHFQTVPYDPAFRKQVLRVFAKEQIRQRDLSGLNVVIADLHAELVNAALEQWGIGKENVDLIASHGQTVYHAPLKDLPGSDAAMYPNSTLQIGDGDHIAVKTGIITVSDFRQKHVAAGGEGAPLALYGDYLLFADDQEDRILLNLGGIANLTYLPSSHSRQTLGKYPFATDLGPANTLMNQYMQREFGMPMDTDGALASRGDVHEALLAALLDDPFFRRAVPRTTGPELFNLAFLKRAQLQSGTEGLRSQDVMATLCAFSAETVARLLNPLLSSIAPKRKAHLYISGGGASNPSLVGGIRRRVGPLTFISSLNQFGIDPAAKEAALFAVLANETIAGNPENVSAFRGVPAICMGKVSFPR